MERESEFIYVGLAEIDCEVALEKDELIEDIWADMPI
jgi:hypothetical protein